MNRIKLLLVEDHVIVREGIGELIGKQEDMEVIGEASTGEEALEMVDRLNPDVVLMDISMQGLNGIEATRHIKKKHPDIKVLILTAYDNEEFILAVIKAKASGYILKNIEGRDLLKAIRGVIEGNSFFHPLILNKILNHLQNEKTDAPVNTIPVLSKREIEVVQFGSFGLTNKEIAYELSLSDRTVQTHWRNIFVKMGVNSRIEAIMECLTQKLIKTKETS